MTTYKYKGISKEGANVNGIIRAYDEYEAVSMLRETCSIVTEIKEVAENQGQKSLSQLKIKPKELAIMCSQFSIILASGMPIVRCIEMVAEQAQNKELKQKLLKIAEDVEGGYTLAQSFETNIPTLPTTFIETIRAGEQSGTLETCFKRLFEYYDKTSKTKAKTSSALTYPAIVITVAIVVFVIIMVVAVPLFEDTFADLGTELPAITKGLIAVSNFFTKYWWVLLIIAGLIFIAIFVIKRTDEGKLKLAEISLFRAPLHGIRQMQCSAQFASTMSTMLGAGLSILKALDVTSHVIDNYAYADAVAKVKDNVELGRTIADSMRDSPCFPKLLTEMTAVGEKSGNMEETLNVVSDYYNNEVQLATDKLLAAMEPAITVGLAVITVILLLAVYMPMFSMYGSVA